MHNHNIKPSTLYVSDMDGTLLGSDSRLSAASALMLNRAIASGVLFTVATARTPATVVPLMSGVDTRLPYICLNGAALWDNCRGDYAHVEVIDEATVRRVVGVYRRHGLAPFVYRRHGRMIHACHDGSPLSGQERQFVAERTGLELKRFFLDCDPCGEGSSAAGEAMLIFSMQDYELLRPVCDEVKAQADCTAVLYHDIFDPRSGILEIYAPGVSKAAAIERVAATTQATRVVVFGDNRNDMSMMRAASWSVAVGNAFPEVKAIASEVIGTNVQDAVPKYIIAQK